MSSEWRTIRYTANLGVATLTLCRPERGNAWTSRMDAEYREALHHADQDETVGVIVITGAGKHFCVGADEQAVARIADDQVYTVEARSETAPGPGVAHSPFAAASHGFLLALTKPVVAAVNGSAAGVGFVITCFADVRFVAESAKLTTATARLGLPAEFAVSWILPRLIGASRAAPLLLGGDVITGREAAEIGLAYRCLPAAEVLDAAQSYARALIDRAAPSSLRVAKAQLWQDFERSLVASDQDARRLLQEMVAQPEFAEGVQALAQRQPPNFARRYGVVEQ